jgi:hypothetical protein
MYSNQDHTDLISTFDTFKSQLIEEQHANDYLQEVAQDLVEQLFSSQVFYNVIEPCVRIDSLAYLIQ